MNTETTAPDTNPDNPKPEPRDTEPGDFTTSHGGTRAEECAVDVNCDRGSPDDWFEVHYAATGEVFHFCKRHAFAAEALITLGGWRARDVPEALRLLERGGARALAGTTHTPRPTVVDEPVVVRCGQATCPMVAVFAYHWPGKGGALFACMAHGHQAQRTAQAMGFEVRLEPLSKAAERLVENGG